MKQKEPVFTYLVSNIGEKLTSVKREEIDDNELPEMESLFHIFMGMRKSCKKILEKETKRCKIQDISLFKTSTHWVIDRFWTHDEKIDIGIIESFDPAKKDDIDTLMIDFDKALQEYDALVDDKYELESDTMEISLGDDNHFKLFIGKRVLKKDLPKDEGNVPLYSANVFIPFGLISKSNIETFVYPCVIWAIDGNFEFNYIPKGKTFATTDHCGTIQIINNKIQPEYLLYALQQSKIEESFDRAFRASLFNMKRFTISIPVKKDGAFDLDVQKKISSLYFSIQEKKEKLVITFDFFPV